jgi:hypothetical protein
MSTPETGLEKAIEVEVDPRLSRGVKAFLRVLNSSGGPPLETLPPLAAREVLVNAQASVPVDLSGIEESEKTITADDYTIKLNVVRFASLVVGHRFCVRCWCSRPIRRFEQRARSSIARAASSKDKTNAFIAEFNQHHPK